MDDRLQGLLDKQEIYEVLLRYTRGLDRLDEELLKSCYHPDAHHDHGMFKGLAVDFIAYAMETLVTMDRTMHSIQNALVKIVAERSAVSESYGIAFHRVPSRTSTTGYADHTVFVRYLDRFTRRGQEPWRIEQRVVVFEWSRVDGIDREWALSDAYARGARSRDDGAYAFGVLP